MNIIINEKPFISLEEFNERYYKVEHYKNIPREKLPIMRIGAKDFVNMVALIKQAEENTEIGTQHLDHLIDKAKRIVARGA